MDGPVDRAALSQPSGLWLEGRTLYFADAEDSAIRLVDLDKSAVRTLAGTGLFDFGDKDGTGNEVLLQHPLAVLFHDGTLYVADAYNHKIKACDPHTRAVRTVSGSGKPGMKDGSEAQFNEPTGLAWLGGNLYIADTNNHAIRVLDPKSRKVATLILTR
jgi:DNA-binding beta-propeller fold protein YncE